MTESHLPTPRLVPNMIAHEDGRLDRTPDALPRVVIDHTIAGSSGKVDWQKTAESLGAQLLHHTTKRAQADEEINRLRYKLLNANTDVFGMEITIDRVNQHWARWFLPKHLRTRISRTAKPTNSETI